MTMQVIRVYAFGCDANGCEGWSDDYVPPGGEPNKAAWARRRARAAGWTFPGSQAKCPRHSQ